jgi:pilus assembly protein CpaE
VIPYDQKAAVNAAKLGQTFVDANRSPRRHSSCARSPPLGAGASDEAGSVPRRQRQGGSSLLGKLDLKSLLGSKKPKAAIEAAEPAPAGPGQGLNRPRSPSDV